MDILLVPGVGYVAVGPSALSSTLVPGAGYLTENRAPDTSLLLTNLASGTGFLQGTPLNTISLVPGLGFVTEDVTDPASARPAMDLSNVGWIPSTGNTLYECIDESSYSDSDYISTEQGYPTTIKLGPVTDPLASSGHVIKFRAKSQNGNTLTVTLRQGSKLIKTYTTTVLTGSFADYSITLDSAEADGISDYNALTITLQANT